MHNGLMRQGSTGEEGILVPTTNAAAQNEGVLACDAVSTEAALDAVFVSALSAHLQRSMVVTAAICTC
jgi:hypothetical protein